MKNELLAPAGDYEKLCASLNYGADAIYLGGEAFGLRKASKNFSKEDMERAVNLTHSMDKKLYVTMNILPHDEDFKGLQEYAGFLRDIGVDAVIISDLGVLRVIRESVPDLAVHISTQASVVNTETVKFFYDLGVRRVILARELNLNEIKRIRDNIPKDMEIECFVHGAMCISYSGRCLLSSYMTGRDANRGECAHPCRYKYTLMEEKRPGEYFPIYEDDNGTFILNSKDLCMIEHIPELFKAGITSFKIEGRVKSSYYIASILRVYRAAIDAYLKDPEAYEYKNEYMEEIKKASYRDFTTGFFFGNPEQNYATSSYIRECEFAGVILGYDEENKRAIIEQRNKLVEGDRIEIFGSDISYREEICEDILNSEGEKVESVPHPKEIFSIRVKSPVKKGEMVRKPKE